MGYKPVDSGSVSFSGCRRGSRIFLQGGGGGGGGATTAVYCALAPAPTGGLGLINIFFFGRPS